MSELKAYNVVATADVNPDVVDILGCTEWFGYDKDEADKVIAEKDKELRHQKYKRCLAMAKWCYSMDCRMLNEASDNGTYYKESWCWKRASWYGKWKRKWLELAERFEEGV